MTFTGQVGCRLGSHLFHTKRSGGNRLLAEVLAGVSQPGLEAVLVAVKLVLESGHPSAEPIKNVRSRLNEAPAWDGQPATRCVLPKGAPASRWPRG